ncbi:Hypothetical_protein [Hexamita inflata]|uniref:Hypothetical_protein n=1 Tax=Hexamita inflata TaxID=28002 RepID=A0AA86TS79_9EUKA|nr:Hypothetical protein HINF_LOCUS8208 [Hexamita inflata]
MWRWSENLETQSIQDASRAILVVNTAAYYQLIYSRVVFHINYRSSPNFVCLCVFLWVWIDYQGQERSCVQGDCILLGYLESSQKAFISQSWQVTSFSSWIFYLRDRTQRIQYMKFLQIISEEHLFKMNKQKIKK